MKLLLSLLSFATLIFAENEDETPNIQEVAITNQPTFTKPMLPLSEQSEPTQITPKAYKSPFLAVTLSVFPGLGHLYLGDYKTAASLAGSSIGFLTVSDLLGDQFSLITGGNITAYSIFAAYRDVRINNGFKNYSYPMPIDSFSDLATAPFNKSILKQPAVWGGLAGALALAATVTYISSANSNGESKAAFANNTLNISSNIFPLAAFSVGVGEEALFRGYLQSFFAEHFGPTPGIILSSLAFGAAHIPNAAMFAPEDQIKYYAYSLPLITSLGAYFGWLTHKTHSLKSSVAIHAWYDFVLFLNDSLATPSASTGKPTFYHSFTF